MDGNTHSNIIDFLPAVCPGCGGQLRVPLGRDRIKCMYCGIDIILIEKTGNQDDGIIENLIYLAKVAENSKNFQEAYRLWSRVLEVDTKNGLAWFGKSRASGWLTTIENPRIDEAVTCLQHGLSINPDRDEIRLTALTLALATHLHLRGVLSFLEATYQNMNPRMTAPDPMQAILIAQSRKVNYQRINNKFLTDYFPVVYRGATSAWHFCDDNEIAKEVRLIVSTMTNSSLSQDTQAHIQKIMGPVLAQIEGKYRENRGNDNKKPSRWVPTKAEFKIIGILLLIFITLYFLVNQ